MDSMELILQELKGINGRLDRIESDVSIIKDDLSELKEEHEITRDGVNKLVGWAEGVGTAFSIPFAKAQ